MCEKCVERIENLDQKVLKIMNDFETEYRNLAAKVSKAYRDIVPIMPVDQDNNEIIMDAEQKKEFDRRSEMVLRMVGMASLLGWYTAVDAADVMEVASDMYTLMETLNQQINNGNAYRTVAMGVKH